MPFANADGGGMRGLRFHVEGCKSFIFPLLISTVPSDKAEIYSAEFTLMQARTHAGSDVSVKNVK